jgi:hypothetical protein
MNAHSVIIEAAKFNKKQLNEENDYGCTDEKRVY